MADTRPIAQATPPNEEELAKRHKAQIAEALDQAAALMTQALRAGFHTAFNIQEVGQQRYVTTLLRVERHY